MIVGRKGVKYGLEVRKPQQASKPAEKPSTSIFGDEESDDEQHNVERQIARQAAKKQTDKKVWAPILPRHQKVPLVYPPDPDLPSFVGVCCRF